MARILYTLGLLTFVTPLVSCAANPTEQPQSQPQAQTEARPIVAMVAGQPVYDDEIVPLAETELGQLRRQEYTIKMKALNQAIDQKLLALEAEKKKVGVEALLKAEADAKASDPTE